MVRTNNLVPATFRKNDGCYGVYFGVLNVVSSVPALTIKGAPTCRPPIITAETNKTGLRVVHVAAQTISIPNHWMTWFGVNYAAIYSTLNYS